jgi:hypothetical protein
MRGTEAKYLVVHLVGESKGTETNGTHDLLGLGVVLCGCSQDPQCVQSDRVVG